MMAQPKLTISYFLNLAFFVIETKNMKGWIFGSEKQKMWTQKIFRYTGQFQNPLRQNYKHTQTLCEKLDLVKEHVHSLVVFVGDCEFKTDMPEKRNLSTRND